MYSQAATAASAFRDTPHSQTKSSSSEFTEAMPKDFDISSPIIDSEGIYEMDMPSGGVMSKAAQKVDLETDSVNTATVKMSPTSEQAGETLNAEQIRPTVVQMEKPKMDHVTSSKVKTSSTSVKQKSGSKSVKARQSISSWDLSKRKEILSSFKPQVGTFTHLHVSVISLTYFHLSLYTSTSLKRECC